MQKFITWADSHRELWLDCVRIYLGLGLFARGLLLITGDTSTRYFVDLMHRAGQSWLATGLLMHYVILAHFVGGLDALGRFLGQEPCDQAFQFRRHVRVQQPHGRRRVRRQCIEHVHHGRAGERFLA